MSETTITTTAEISLTPLQAYEVVHAVRSYLAIIDAALPEREVWHAATADGIGRLLEKAMKDLEDVGDYIMERKEAAND